MNIKGQLYKYYGVYRFIGSHQKNETTCLVKSQFKKTPLFTSSHMVDPTPCQQQESPKSKECLSKSNPGYILLPIPSHMTGNQWAHGKCSSKTPIFPQEASGFIAQKAPQISSYTILILFLPIFPYHILYSINVLEDNSFNGKNQQGNKIYINLCYR